ncbi:MAG TPA: TrkA C-terminal domain-containing protein, partial [Symbiobacteriaceae bacterium]|nr:TrkA C-terminal domain-containing protein [Symbiobacteriaceae bacterium]
SIYIMQRIWKTDYAREAEALTGMGISEPISNVTVRVNRAELAGLTVREVVEQHDLKAVFGRLKRDEHHEVVSWKTRLWEGDLLTVVGTDKELERVAAVLGEQAGEEAEFDRHEVDARRMFVSNPQVAGMRIRDLKLPQQHGAIITRVRRGDVDLLPRAEMVLELGDRVRVLARRSSLGDVARFFGDSVRALSEIDISSWALGLALGVALGAVPIPLPGGIIVKLGLAGGPLIVALLLGTLHRSGPFVWSLPYSANLTLRQIGLIFFLAGVGTRSGYEFYRTLLSGSGLALLGAAAVIATTVGLLTLVIGHKVMKLPMSVVVGLVAAVQTQPATLAFALEQTGNELPNVGYATVYAASMISKIVIVQILLAFLL